MAGVFWALAPQLFGGASTPWALSIAGLSAVALTAVLLADLPLPRSHATFAVLAAAIWTLVQRIPLPRQLLAWLSPDRVTEVDATYALLGEDAPRWIPISLDPGGTALAFVAAAAVASSWLVGGALARAGGRRAVYRLVAASALLMAAVVWMHLVSGSEKVFGFYQPRYAAPWPVAPLMNQNHLAAFMAFGATICLGLGATAPAREARIWWIAGAVVCGTLVPMTRSRGGMLGLGVSLLLLGIGTLRTRRATTTRTIVAGGAMVMLLAGAYLGYQELAAKVNVGDYSKLGVAAKAFTVAASFPLLGIGRGAFSPVFGRVAGANVRFDHPENFLAQWSTEWGIPFTLLFSIALAAALLRAFRSRPETAMMVAALIGLVVHDLVDFSLELLGVAVVAAGLAGAATMERKERLGRAWGIATGSCVALGAAWCLYTGVEEPGAASRRARDLVEQGERADLTDAVQAHPLEPGLVLLVAWQRERSGEIDAGRWLNRAMELAPQWPGPHLLAARWLWKRGSLDQAALEAREAEYAQAHTSVSTVCAWLRAGADVRYAWSAAPRHQVAAVEFYDALARCLGAHPTVPALDARILTLAPATPGPALRAAVMQTGSEQTATLERVWSESRAQSYAVRLPIALALADARVRGEQLDQAASVLDELAAEGANDAAWMRARARVAVHQGDEERSQLLLGRLRGQAGGSGLRLAQVLRFEAGLRRETGSLHRALGALEEAYRVAPDPGTLRSVAQLADEVGAHGRAHRAWRRLCDQGSIASDCAKADAHETVRGP